MTTLFDVADVFTGCQVVVCGQDRRLTQYEGLMDDCPFWVLTQYVYKLEIEAPETVVFYTRRVISHV